MSGARPEHAARDTALRLVPLALAMACWTHALTHADLDRIAGKGLLDALPATYYATLALITVGFALSVLGAQVRFFTGVVYLLALVLVIHGTPAVLYDVPRYAWTYKHLGVIGLIAREGAPDRNLDIYANWPAFFGMNAWFADAANLNPLRYAQWMQVFFNLTYVAALLFVFRSLTTNGRVVLVAIWLFLLGNWIGQDFLAPQAFAFLGLLVLAGLYLRGASAPRTPRSRPIRWLAGLEDRLRRLVLPSGSPAEPVHRPGTPTLPARTALGLGTLCFVAIVITHQLTPVVLIIVATALALVIRRLPLWVPIGMAVIEGLWLLPAQTYISNNYNLFDFNSLARPRPTGADPTLALPGAEFASRGSQVTVLLIVLLAAIGLARRARAGRWDLELVVLILAPVIVIPIQTYGGEAPLRVYLFALPWLAFLGAWALLPAPTALRRSAGLAATTLVLATAFLFAAFGLEKMNHITADDVAAAEWIEGTAPRGTLVTYIAPNFPVRATGRYPEVVQGTDLATRELLAAPAEADDPAGQRRWAEREVRALNKLQSESSAPAYYVVVSPSQANYLELYGLANPSSITALTDALGASPQYREVFRDGAARVYRWTR